MEDLEKPEIVNLDNEGSLEIFENKEKNIEIETKTGKIYKSEILFLVIPGGAYEFYVDIEAYPVVKKFLSLGYSSALLRYSFSKNYPIFYNQGLKSIELLSSKFKKIILIGFSAGGHLAGLLGTTERSKLFNAVGMILCYPVISFVKNAHVGSRKNFFGDKMEDNEENRKLYSIDYRVNSNTLPTFIWTCKPDKIVDYENTVFMIEKLKENNVLFDYRVFETGFHGIVFSDEKIIENGIEKLKNEEVHEWLGAALDLFDKVIKNN